MGLASLSCSQFGVRLAHMLVGYYRGEVEKIVRLLLVLKSHGAWHFVIGSIDGGIDKEV